MWAEEKDALEFCERRDIVIKDDEIFLKSDGIGDTVAIGESS